MQARLLTALESGHVVLTAQRRQARHIRFRFAVHKQERQEAAFETPQVYGWDDWLSRVNAEIMWSGYSGPRNQRKLLSACQEHVLWERVIRERDDVALDDLAGAARKARQAWGLIQSYRLPDPVTAAFANSDVSAFSSWMRSYHSICADQALMDHARLSDTIGPALRAGVVQMPPEIQLVGFDEFTPQQRMLLKSLENLGTRLSRVKGPRIRSDAQHVRFPDPESEYRAAARWILAQLDQDHGGHIAVLVPELARARIKIERIFDDVLMPGSALPSSSSGGRPYNVSVGPSFPRYPIVAAALAVCELATGEIEFPALSSLLRSPFTRAAGAEQSLRARFELWLREKNLASIRGERLLVLVRAFRERAKGGDDSVLEAMLTGLGPTFSHARTDASGSHWAALFKEMLDVCGWPGDVPLDSGEFQTAERFRSLLDELAGLDFMAPPMSARAALTLLRRLCLELTFQPQTPELSVEILLPEQAYGLEFDRIWVCGWHAEAWPRPPDPNPFVPIEWQRQYKIARGTPEAELEFAKRLTKRVLSGAARIVISTPTIIEDRPVSASPLVTLVCANDEASLALPEVTDYRATIRDATEMEIFADDTGPALEVFERVGGGAGIFTLQSQCPFRAFSQLRLAAKEMPEPAPGLDARERGNLVHKSLEAIWRRLGSWDVLAELIGGEYLQVQVWEIVDEVLSSARQNGMEGLTPRVRDIEQQRLVRLVMEWLHLEAQRPPFEVADLEADRAVRIGELEIKMRVDRTDRFPDGSIAVIDYKTGKPNASDWFDERPGEPQLPLYAIAADGRIAAVLFGQVRTNDVAFVGVSDAADRVPGVAAFDSTQAAKKRALDWPGLISVWRKNLTTLAERYAAGDARVDPNKNACRYCHLSALCRIGDTVKEKG